LGSAKHKPEQSAIVWNIKSFAGQIEVTLRASVELIPTSMLFIYLFIYLFI
jgi:hypothetical protein